MEMFSLEPGYKFIHHLVELLILFVFLHSRSQISLRNIVVKHFVGLPSKNIVKESVIKIIIKSVLNMITNLQITSEEDTGFYIHIGFFEMLGSQIKLNQGS